MDVNKLPKAILNVAHRDLGWIVELQEGDREILAALYTVQYPGGTEEFERMPGEDLHVMKDEPLDKVVAHVEKVATGMGFQVERLQDHVLSVSARPHMKIHQPGKFSVDLRHALWYAERSDWEDQDESEAYEAMKGAFEGTGPIVEVSTNPGRGSGLGSVEISHGKAFVDFKLIWDAPWDLVPDRCPESMREFIAKAIEEHFDAQAMCGYGGYLDGDGEDPIGAEVDAMLEAASFEELMAKIDDLENDLRKQNQDNEKNFDEWLDYLIDHAEDHGYELAPEQRVELETWNGHVLDHFRRICAAHTETLRTLLAQARPETGGDLEWTGPRPNGAEAESDVVEAAMAKCGHKYYYHSAAVPETIQRILEHPTSEEMAFLAHFTKAST